MAICEWAIVCDYAFYAEEKKVSMIGVFDRIWVASVPTTHHQSAICIRLLGNPKENVDFKVTITRPTGGTLGGAGIGGKIELGDAGTAEIVVNLGNLPLPDLGIYSIKVIMPGQPPKIVTLNVGMLPKPETQGES